MNTSTLWNIIFTLLMFSTLVLVMLAQAFVEASPTTTVEVGTKSLYPDESSNVPIDVKDIPANVGLGVYDLEATLNPSVVEVLDVLGGSSPFDSVTAQNIN